MDRFIYLFFQKLLLLQLPRYLADRFPTCPAFFAYIAPTASSLIFCMFQSILPFVSFRILPGKTVLPAYAALQPSHRIYNILY